ncbi:MAG TPA: hypothetical protein VF525_10700 [Pyrinomonadaceae bacterium]|jgi:hypothetical protein
MKQKDWLYWLLLLIAAATALTGLVQALAPASLLHLLDADATTTSSHFFAIVGMFMLLFGGATMHALLSERHHPVVILWSSLQKFGAAGAVGLGVGRGVFSTLALAVAIIDFLSGVLGFLYWLRIRRQ